LALNVVALLNCLLLSFSSESLLDALDVLDALDFGAEAAASCREEAQPMTFSFSIATKCN
jgi:hypothetical protein